MLLDCKNTTDSLGLGHGRAVGPRAQRRTAPHAYTLVVTLCSVGDDLLPAVAFGRAVFPRRAARTGQRPVRISVCTQRHSARPFALCGGLHGVCISGEQCDGSAAEVGDSEGDGDGGAKLANGVNLSR